MVTIITGKINDRDSSESDYLFDSNMPGDGFISVKTGFENEKHSYDILRLTTGETMPFIVSEDQMIDGLEIACQIGPAIFLQETLNYVENEIEKMIEQGVSPIYLDELGQLELYDECFHHIFTKMILAGVDCVITVKEDLVDNIIDKYGIKAYQILRVKRT